MWRKHLFSNLQYLTLIFMISSFIFEFKLIKENLFTLYLVVLLGILVFIFAYYGRKKEKGIMIASIPLAAFNIIGFGVYGVPEYFAIKHYLSGISDMMVSIVQFIVILVVVSLFYKKKLP